MHRARIQSWRIATPTVKSLSEMTGFLRLRSPERTTFRGTPKDLIFNWGSSQDIFCGPLILNPPDFVVNAIDKERSFEKFLEHDVSTLEATKELDEAFTWVNEDNSKGLVARFLSCSFGGRGAVFVKTEEEINNLLEEDGHPKLWTKYVPKFDEYRIHVWQNGVVDFQQKKLKNGYTPQKVRTHDTGYVFARENVNPPEVVIEEAFKAVKSLRLDFGAVDVGFTRSNSRATVYEVNTAPGLEGATLKGYVERFLETYQQFKDDYYE